jgi:cation transport ATPase
VTDVDAALAEGRSVLVLDSAELRVVAGHECGHAVADQPCVFLCDASGWVATFVLDEGVRDEAAGVVARLHELGLQTRLLSGDRTQPAERVARQLGIQSVVAQASPEHKLAEVLALQQQGHRLAMVGDGLNDAPALAVNKWAIYPPVQLSAVERVLCWFKSNCPTTSAIGMSSFTTK